MANRVDGDDVKGIFDTTLTAGDLGPFIDTANALVNEHLQDEGVGSTLLTQIEKWLSAHFAAMWDQRVSEESVGQSRWKYEGSDGMALQSTRYGQQAVALDPTGKLAKLNETRKQFRFQVGKDIDYL